jgi:hypothetical protein
MSPFSVQFVRHRGKRLRQYQQMYRQQQQALHSDAPGEEPHQQQQAADSTGGEEDSSEDDDEEDSDGQGAGSEEDGRSAEEGDGQDEDERCTAGSGGAGASGDASRPRSSGPDSHGPRRSRHAAAQRTARQPAREPLEWPYISEAQLELADGWLHKVHAAANFLRTPCGSLVGVPSGRACLAASQTVQPPAYYACGPVGGLHSPSAVRCNLPAALLRLAAALSRPGGRGLCLLAGDAQPVHL